VRSAASNAVRLGVRRGMTELGQSLRSPQDLGFTLATTGLVLGYLLVRRDDRVPGHRPARPDRPAAEPARRARRLRARRRPGVRAVLQREDGTLLRYKAMPHGVRAYFTSQLVALSGGVLPQVLALLVPKIGTWGCSRSWC
jgi:ABC-2 type transport system permease protein